MRSLRGPSCARASRWDKLTAISHEPSPPRKLPVVTCYPCPHGAACCVYGVDLIGDEVDAVRNRHGAAAVVWDEEEASWRTSVVDGKCFFLRDGLCSIHAEPYYPRTCRGFPYTDGETGGPYEYDQTICPDFT